MIGELNWLELLGKSAKPVAKFFASFRGAVSLKYSIIHAGPLKGADLYSPSLPPAVLGFFCALSLPLLLFLPLSLKENRIRWTEEGVQTMLLHSFM